MNESFNPQVAAENVRDTLRQAAVQFEDLDTPVSEAMRALAEKNVAQTRELYEHSKHALEAALETLEKSFDAVGQGATALNRKVMALPSATSIPASILRRAWPGQRISLRSSNCKGPIGANSSTRLEFKRRRCARCRIR